MSRQATIVVVPSTFCNLRCSYCYELPLLADKARMGHDDMARMFEHLGAFFAESGVTVARFVWHGGEPLLLPPEYFWKAFELQEKAFGGMALEVQNATQTNLTVLDEGRIDLLRNGFKDGVGVSLDLFGSLRVNAGGVGKEDIAKKNLDMLLGRGLPLSGITVLTKGNRRRMKAVYQFYRERRMSFRLLPLHKGDYGEGHWFEITASDTLRALCELADLWLYDEDPIVVYPIAFAIRDAIDNLVDGVETPAFDRRAFDPVLIVDKDGRVYAFSDFPSDLSYGNLFHEPMSVLLASDGRRRVVEASEARIDANCRKCPHFQKRCAGTPMAEYTTDFYDREADGSLRCTYRGVIEHVLRRFEEGGIRAPARATPAMETSP